MTSDTERLSEGAAMDASKRTADELDRKSRERAAGAKEWAEAEARGEKTEPSGRAKPRPGKPATGEAQARRNEADGPPA